MSDKQDQKTVKIKPSAELPDLENTVRLDFSNNQNVFSTSSTDESTPDDFDFGDLDAGMDALTQDLLEPLSESNENKKDTKATDTSNDLISNARIDTDEEENIFDIEQSMLLESNNENELLIESPDSLTDDDLLITEHTDDSPSSTDDFLSDTPAGIDEGIERTENDSDEGLPPIIKLTKEMLDEPEQVPFSEFNDSQNNSDIENNNSDSAVETPELTTTETHILADATAAIKEMTDEEEYEKIDTGNSEAPVATEFSPIESETGQNRSSNTLPTFIAILGIAVGGFAVWMTVDANNQIADLERKLQNMRSAATTAKTHEMTAVQQRLTKIEKRLTGTPTIEAATALSSVAPEAKEAAPETTSAVKIITPQTEVTNTQKSTGDWVINLSSHIKASLAKNEQARLLKKGINSEIHTAKVRNKVWYRVQITGFASKSEAKAKLKDVQQQAGIQGIWIGKK